MRVTFVQQGSSDPSAPVAKLWSLPAEQSPPIMKSPSRQITLINEDAQLRSSESAPNFSTEKQNVNKFTENTKVISYNEETKISDTNLLSELNDSTIPADLQRVFDQLNKFIGSQ